MTNRISRRAIACALLATTSLTLPVAVRAETPAPKFVDTIDDHGVDLVTGLPFLQIDEGGIGSGPGAVRMQRTWAEGAGFVDNWTGGLYAVTSGGVTKMYVQFAGISDTFSGSGTTWTSDKAEGATLTVDPVSFIWTYTARDGTKVTFSDAGAKAWNCPGATPNSCQVPLSITQPNGLQFTLNWFETENNVGITIRRLSGVTSSAGYSVAFTYVSNIVGNADWHKRASATFDNSANHPSPLPSISYAYPSSTEIDVTDPASRTWKFFTDTNGRLTGVRRPGSASNNITYGYTLGKVTSSTKDGVANSYSDDGSEMLVTNPLSQQTVVSHYTNNGRPMSVTDPLSHTTSFQYDSNTRLTRITAPEGNYVQYTYDGRGNVNQTLLVPKSGSGLGNITASASYDATCTSATIVKCNKPNSTTDARGHTTDYLYNPTHGGVTSITQPDPGNGIRPQTRFSYSLVGGAGGQSVYMLTKVAACQTLAATSCPSPNAADETQIVTGYNTNLLPTSVTRQDGTPTLISTSTMSYDSHGNVTAVDGPLSGTADTTAYKYDSADQLVGTISPDPDGSGTGNPNRAIRLTYRSDGQVSKQELGTTNGQDATAWAAFSPLQTVDITFDTNNRPVTSKLSASGTNYALTQTSYDALGRTDCTAVRMNIAAFGSLPASACTLGTQGSDGPDRISQLVYDAAGEVTQLKVGVGTSDAATERTLTYTNDGLVQTLLDAENNKTTYVYDGFDRLSQTQYPNTTKGSGTSNAGDYEQLSYDANSNVTSLRVRSGGTINFGYDNLDRRVAQSSSLLADRAFSYDNLSRMLTATFTSGSQGVTNTYDALSRPTSSSSNMGGPAHGLSYAYDLAGRRTRLTWWDGFYVDYDRLVTGEPSKVRANGATSGAGVLGTFGYDNLGNRTSLARGNGLTTSYAYDAVSRLQSLHDFAGTASDLTITLLYNAASQIGSATRSNDAYAFSPIAGGTTSYTSNGLNQLTAAGAASPTYDANGNLNYDGTRTYAYDIENKLASTTGGGAGTAFNYDPLNRLDTYNNGTTSRFIYDGDEVAAALDASGNITRRQVRGDAADEVLVEYNTSDWRYFHADERGSTIAWSDPSGAVASVLSYDEYGMPKSTNPGLFQYTGQMWLPDAGVYNYKARVYLPQLGVFGQTDPIGQTDSPNLYAYVRGDPVNLNDPLGLQEDKAIVVTGTQISSSVPGSDFILELAAFMGDLARQLDPIIVTARRPPIVVTGRRPPVLVRAIRGVGSALDSLADWIGPGEKKKHGESTRECIARVAGADPALAISGAAGIAAGGAFLGYPRIPFAGGGGGTSLISSAARGAFGTETMGGARLFGTGLVGGAVGRFTSVLSVGTGAAILGHAAGHGVGTIQVCTR